MFKTTLIAIVIMVLSGCTSMYVYPRGEDLSEQGMVSSRLKGLVLGIDRSQSVVDYRGLPPHQTGAPYDLQTLVDALNEHQVFQQTAYLDDPGLEPDLILSNYRPAQAGFRGIHGEQGGPLCVGYYYPISLLTLTILPIYCSSEEQVSFTLSHPNDPSENYFRFSRHSKQVFGIWAPVVAAANPSWESTGTTSDDGGKRENAERELEKHYKRFVVQWFREFEPIIIEVLNEGE